MKIKVPPHLAAKRPEAFLVGGSVRDLIRGQKPRDYDIAVQSNPGGYAEHIARRARGRVVLLGKERLMVHRVVTPQWCLDIMPFKGRDIYQDLQTRDFTINALACDLSDGSIIDVTGGLDDLRNSVVRMVSRAIFQQDPARLVRAFRMAATLGFNIEPTTREAIRADAALLNNTAGERIWAELILILSCDRCHPFLCEMVAADVMRAIFPELAPLATCQQNQYHDMDVMSHSLQAIASLEDIFAGAHSACAPAAKTFVSTLTHRARALLKLALLLHDTGKPECRSTDANGRIHFHGHAARGAELMQVIGRRLRMSNREKTWVVSLIRRHQRPLSLFLAHHDDQGPGPKAVGRFFSQCGDHTACQIIMAMADNLGKSKLPLFHHGPMTRFLDTLLETYLGIDQGGNFTPLLNGRDLLASFDLKPSPLIGALLRRVEELQLGGALSTRQQALQWVQEHLSSVKRESGSPKKSA